MKKRDDVAASNLPRSVIASGAFGVVMILAMVACVPSLADGPDQEPDLSTVDRVLEWYKDHREPMPDAAERFIENRTQTAQLRVRLRRMVREDDPVDQALALRIASDQSLDETLVESLPGLLRSDSRNVRMGAARYAILYVTEKSQEQARRLPAFPPKEDIADDESENAPTSVPTEFQSETGLVDYFATLGIDEAADSPAQQNHLVDAAPTNLALIDDFFDVAPKRPTELPTIKLPKTVPEYFVAWRNGGLKGNAFFNDADGLRSGFVNMAKSSESEEALLGHVGLCMLGDQAATNAVLIHLLSSRADETGDQSSNERYTYIATMTPYIGWTDSMQGQALVGALVAKLNVKDYSHVSRLLSSLALTPGTEAADAIWRIRQRLQRQQTPEDFGESASQIKYALSAVYGGPSLDPGDDWSWGETTQTDHSPWQQSTLPDGLRKHLTSKLDSADDAVAMTALAVLNKLDQPQSWSTARQWMDDRSFAPAKRRMAAQLLLLQDEANNAELILQLIRDDDNDIVKFALLTHTRQYMMQSACIVPLLSDESPSGWWNSTYKLEPLDDVEALRMIAAHGGHPEDAIAAGMVAIADPAAPLTPTVDLLRSTPEDMLLIRFLMQVFASRDAVDDAQELKNAYDVLKTVDDWYLSTMYDGLATMKNDEAVKLRKFIRKEHPHVLQY